jgi:hypothetical protein
MVEDAGEELIKQPEIRDKDRRSRTKFLDTRDINRKR